MRGLDVVPLSRHWDWFWRWPGIQRIRVFLWLTHKERLLTNAERLRRGMSSSSACSICNAGDENLDHILRHCNTAKRCWEQILPPNKRMQFYSQPFQDWLLWNLNPRCMGMHWRLYFGTLCWKLWDNRNKNIFTSEAMSPESIILFVSSFVNHMASTADLLSCIHNQN